MLENGWKVDIRKPIWGEAVQIFIYRYLQGKVQFMSPDKFGAMNLVEFENGAVMLNAENSPNPVLTLSGREANQILKELAEAIDRQGVKTDQDAKTEGLLEATKYHLEDLRRIMKIGRSQNGS